MISDAEIIDLCGRISEALTPPSNYWLVWIETADLDGATSYTYRMGECADNADDAITQAVHHCPHFEITQWGEPSVRIRSVTAVRKDYVTEHEGTRFRSAPQFYRSY